MRSRLLLTSAVAVAVSIPAVAVADGIPAHSNLYQMHSGKTSVFVTYHRNTGRALVQVTNPCLGSYLAGPPGGQQVRVTNAAIASSVRVAHGRITYRGPARIYGAKRGRTIRMVISARLTAKQVSGTASFPAIKKCGTIHFVAKLFRRTK